MPRTSIYALRRIPPATHREHLTNLLQGLSTLYFRDRHDTVLCETIPQTRWALFIDGGSPIASLHVVDANKKFATIYETTNRKVGRTPAVFSRVLNFLGLTGWNHRGLAYLQIRAFTATRICKHCLNGSATTFEINRLNNLSEVESPVGWRSDVWEMADPDHPFFHLIRDLLKFPSTEREQWTNSPFWTANPDQPPTVTPPETPTGLTELLTPARVLGGPETPPTLTMLRFAELIDEADRETT